MHAGVAPAVPSKRTGFVGCVRQYCYCWACVQIDHTSCSLRSGIPAKNTPERATAACLRVHRGLRGKHRLGLPEQGDCTRECFFWRELCRRQNGKLTGNSLFERARSRQDAYRTLPVSPQSDSGPRVGLLKSLFPARGGPQSTAKRLTVARLLVKQVRHEPVSEALVKRGLVYTCVWGEHPAELAGRICLVKGDSASLSSRSRANLEAKVTSLHGFFGRAWAISYSTRR